MNIIQQLIHALLSEWSACHSADTHGISEKCSAEDCTFTYELFRRAVEIARDGMTEDKP